MTYHNADPKPGKKKKKKRPTDEPYLKFIRSQPCIISGQKSVAHHEPIGKTGGMAIKCSDRETLPLNHILHSERHQIGKCTFYDKYKINFEYEIKRLQRKYDNSYAVK